MTDLPVYTYDDLVAMGVSFSELEPEVGPTEEFPKIDRREEFNRLYQNMGKRYDIVLGGFIENANGTFLATDKLVGTNIIYLNKSISDFVIISDNPFVGLEYKLATQNCANLVVDFLEIALPDVGFAQIMDSIPFKTRLKYFTSDIDPLLRELGFIKINVADIQQYDMLVWQYNDTATSHLAAYLGNNKILHHIPNRLSCIDEIDLTSNKLLGVYRYGN